MKGLELAKEYYLTYGKKMLEEEFSSIIDEIAVGLFGSGSECFGFDDDISKDHDFEPGFCIFVKDEIDDKTFFSLEKAYNKLPLQFKGYKKNLFKPIGLKRHGVFKVGSFFNEHIGSKDGNLSIESWLRIPEYVLAEMTNGEIFIDKNNIINDIRERLRNMPQDVLLKRLSGNILIMHQAGQYNYERCLKRKELAASQLAINEFVMATLKTIFLLNKVYLPYYKWSFKALRRLDKLTICADILEYLLCSNNEEKEAINKIEMINNICYLINKELIRKKYSSLDDLDFEKQAYHINDKIIDNDIRNLDIMYTI